MQSCYWKCRQNTTFTIVSSPDNSVASKSICSATGFFDVIAIKMTVVKVLIKKDSIISTDVLVISDGRLRTAHNKADESDSRRVEASSHYFLKNIIFLLKYFVSNSNLWFQYQISIHVCMS